MGSSISSILFFLLARQGDVCMMFVMVPFTSLWNAKILPPHIDRRFHHISAAVNIVYAYDSTYDILENCKKCTVFEFILQFAQLTVVFSGKCQSLTRCFWSSISCFGDMALAGQVPASR